MEGINSHWEMLQLCSNFPIPPKSYLVVKGQYMENAIAIFRGNEVKITIEKENI